MTRHLGPSWHRGDGGQAVPASSPGPVQTGSNTSTQVDLPPDQAPAPTAPSSPSSPSPQPSPPSPTDQSPSQTKATDYFGGRIPIPVVIAQILNTLMVYASTNGNKPGVGAFVDRPFPFVVLAGVVSGFDVDYVVDVDYSSMFKRVLRDYGLYAMHEYWTRVRSASAVARIGSMASLAPSIPGDLTPEASVKAALTDWPRQIVHAIVLLDYYIEARPTLILPRLSERSG